MAADAAKTRNLCRLHVTRDEFLDVLHPGAKCGRESRSGSKHHPELEPCSWTQSVVLVKLSTGAIGTAKPEQHTPTSAIPGRVPHAGSTPSPRGGISTRELHPRLLARLSFDFHAATCTIRYNSVKRNSHKALLPYGNKLRDWANTLTKA